MRKGNVAINNRLVTHYAKIQDSPLNAHLFSLFVIVLISHTRPYMTLGTSLPLKVPMFGT